MPMPMPMPLGLTGYSGLEESYAAVDPTLETKAGMWFPPMGESTKTNNTWAEPWKIAIGAEGSSHVRPVEQDWLNHVNQGNSHYYMPQGLMESMNNSLENLEEDYGSQANLYAEGESDDELKTRDGNQMVWLDRLHQRRRDRKRRQRQRKVNGKAQRDMEDGSYVDEVAQPDTSRVWHAVPPGLFAVKADVQASDSRMYLPYQQQQRTSEHTCDSRAEPPERCQNKWHSSALVAGDLYQDGHVFVKTEVGPFKNHAAGAMLSSLCMIFEQKLVAGGSHTYCYSIIGGSVGAADGVGFVLDTKIRRNNIQRMRSVFLNKHGQVCLRNLDQITKLPCSLPKLAVGARVTLRVDLDRATAQFKTEDASQNCTGIADLSFRELTSPIGQAPATGFFCAVLTGNLTVSLY